MQRKKLWLLIPALILAVLVGFVIWGSTPLGPGNIALQSLESSSEVQVEEMPGLIAFYPENVTPELGLIFYPGGHVDYRSYSPALERIAQAGYLVLLPSMPLNLAVFDANRAEEIIAAYPQIKQWVIGGHSLGGAMAANYVYTHQDRGYGLLLWASYPAENNSLADSNVKVLSIYGTRDGGLEGLENSADLLPSSTRWVVMEGGNHAQFADYGKQPGDQDPLISFEEQQQIIVDESVNFLQSFLLN